MGPQDRKLRKTSRNLTAAPKPEAPLSGAQPNAGLRAAKGDAILEAMGDMPSKDVDAFLRVRRRLGDLAVIRYLARLQHEALPEDSDPRIRDAGVALGRDVEAALQRFARSVSATVAPAPRAETRTVSYLDEERARRAGRSIA